MTNRILLSDYFRDNKKFCAIRDRGKLRFALNHPWKKW